MGEHAEVVIAERVYGAPGRGAAGGDRTMGRIVAKAIAAAVMFVSTVTAAAEMAAVHVVSGTDLYTWCLSAAQYQVGLCDGYIEGIADVMQERKTIGGFAACVPVPSVIKFFRHASHRNPRPGQHSKPG